MSDEKVIMKSTFDLDEAINFVRQGGSTLAAKSLIKLLLAAEKKTRGKVHYDYAQLLGTWRLGFITDNQKMRQKGSSVIETGRFSPRWLNIQVTYTAAHPSAKQGQVQNLVKVGPLNLQLSGPTQFYPKTNSLAFDFPLIQIRLGKLTLYDGFIWNGQKRESQFYQQSLKHQAFFSYFWVTPTAIAARGREGDLALWVQD